MELVRKSFWLLLLVTALPALSQPVVINCPSGFSASGSCGVAFPGGGTEAFQIVSSNQAFAGTAVALIPTGSSHFGSAMNFSQVNVQAFDTVFSVATTGWNVGFTVQNNTNTAASGGLGKGFGAGAGCEGGFYQGFTANNLSTNNIYTISWSQGDSLTSGASNFTFSGVQTFITGQSPCNPNLGGSVPYSGQNKFSTSPVNMTLGSGNAYGCGYGNGCNTVAGANITGTISGTTLTVASTIVGTIHIGQTVSGASIADGTSIVSGSGTTYTLSGSNTVGTAETIYLSDQYIMHVWYTGTTFSYTMYDVSAGGTCTPITSGSCATHVWTGVNIPSIVGANTAYPAIVAGSGDDAVTSPLLINSWVYTVLTAAAAPTFSPVAGTYTGTQTVTISSTSTGNTICVTTDGTTPATDGAGGCNVGTKYVSPITVSVSETVKAVAGTGSTAYGDSSVASAAYVINTNGPLSTLKGNNTYKGNSTIH